MGEINIERNIHWKKTQRKRKSQIKNISKREYLFMRKKKTKRKN